MDLKYTFCIFVRAMVPHFDLSHLTRLFMGSSRFWLKVADEDSKSFPHEFPRSQMVKGDRSVRNRALPVGDNENFCRFLTMVSFS